MEPFLRSFKKDSAKTEEQAYETLIRPTLVSCLNARFSRNWPVLRNLQLSCFSSFAPKVFNLAMTSVIYDLRKLFYERDFCQAFLRLTISLVDDSCSPVDKNHSPSGKRDHEYN